MERPNYLSLSISTQIEFHVSSGSDPVHWFEVLINVLGQPFKNAWEMIPLLELSVFIFSATSFLRSTSSARQLQLARIPSSST
jgi:hypothetical protein